MTAFEWIVAIVVFGGILYGFSKAFEHVDGLPRLIVNFLLKTLLFIPALLYVGGLHVSKDFRSHRLGYIILFLIAAILAFGFIMGIRAGPETPAPWE